MQEQRLIIVTEFKEVTVEQFDDEKQLRISTGEEATWLNVYQTHQLISYLTEQLKRIGEFDENKIK